VAIEQELPALVAQAKEQLTDQSRWICDQVAAGKSIADLARDMGVTTKTARYARERALAEFRAVWLRMFGRGYEHPC
jgi:DNA-binding CsgD family transcriptional regulator